MPTPLATPAGRHLASRSLQRLGLLVRALVALGALVLATVPPWLWLSADWLQQHARQNLGIIGPVTVDTRAQWLTAAAGLPGLAVGFFLLWQLWLLFGEYGQGQVFSRRAVRCLRRFALGVLAMGLMAPLARTASILALTVGNPPGQRQLVLGISSDDYLHVLLGAVLLAIAMVMVEAARVAQENAEFV
jgi:hypothetical protein